METKAIARYIRIPPLKVRRVLALVRGRDVAEALAVLKFTPGTTPPAVAKVIASAAANAEANNGLVRERLWIRRAYADEAPSMRRFRAGSMGRGGVIKRRMSHITVVVDERPAEEAAPGRRRRAPRAEK